VRSEKVRKLHGGGRIARLRSHALICPMALKGGDEWIHPGKEKKEGKKEKMSEGVTLLGADDDGRRRGGFYVDFVSGSTHKTNQKMH